MLRFTQYRNHTILTRSEHLVAQLKTYSNVKDIRLIGLVERSVYGL